MSQRAILAALKSGPKTNAQLQRVVVDHSAGIARTCAKLIASGRVKRVDGQAGRGAKAKYALEAGR